jgi:hypothetical protein
MSSNNNEIILIVGSILALVIFGLGGTYAASSGYNTDKPNDWTYKLPVGLITFILFALWFFLGIPKYQK